MAQMSPVTLTDPSHNLVTGSLTATGDFGSVYYIEATRSRLFNQV